MFQTNAELEMEGDLRHTLLAAAVFCLLAVAVSSEAGTAG